MSSRKENVQTATLSAETKGELFGKRLLAATEYQVVLDDLVLENMVFNLGWQRKAAFEQQTPEQWIRLKREKATAKRDASVSEMSDYCRAGLELRVSSGVGMSQEFTIQGLLVDIALEDVTLTLEDPEHQGYTLNYAELLDPPANTRQSYHPPKILVEFAVLGHAANKDWLFR